MAEYAIHLAPPPFALAMATISEDSGRHPCSVPFFILPYLLLNTRIYVDPGNFAPSPLTLYNRRNLRNAHPWLVDEGYFHPRSWIDDSVRKRGCNRQKVRRPLG